MTEDRDPQKPAVTPRRAAIWLSPFFVSLLVLGATFALNWEPWFGYASVIAGALGSLMLVSEAMGWTGA
ncbi:MAG: hypothetical protein ACLFQ5_08545 [Oceanicaulis sp.]